MTPLLALVPRHETRNEMVQEGVQEPLLASEAAASHDSEAGLPPISPGEHASRFQVRCHDV